MIQGLLSTAVLSISLVAPTFAATLKTPQTNYISITKPSDIYIVTATPILSDTAYRLAIKTEENGEAVMETTHSLDGSIFDISIRDVDEDGQEELVVSIADNSLGKQQVHFDVYEFEEKHLSWVENFQNIGNLLRHLDL